MQQMKALVQVGLFAIMLVTAATLAAQSNPQVVTAFEHYEAVRVALSADKLEEVAAPAKQLAAMVEPIAGAEAQKSASALAAAKTIDDARQHFGELSTGLVPVFQAEKIPGTFAYMCAMKQKSWVQRGDKVENPYYGKSMLTCGTPLPAKK
jgi:hypothetical protein